MSSEYFVNSSKGREGPYDLMSLVRKIRNGSINPQTSIERGDAPAAKPAHDWPEIAEFFAEKKEELRNHPAEHAREQTSLANVLRTGTHFLQLHSNSTIYSGMLVLFIISIAAIINFMLPEGLHAFAFMAAFALVHFLLSGYMLSALRMVRGQPVDGTYLQSKMGPSAKSLLMTALLSSLPAMFGLALLTSNLPQAALFVGLLIFAVPGLFVLALYAFAPLLILDKGYDFWEGMEASRKAILGRGLEFAGVIYALFVINFLAGLCILLPMAITLPITMGALAELYDEIYS